MYQTLPQIVSFDIITIKYSPVLVSKDQSYNLIEPKIMDYSVLHSCLEHFSDLDRTNFLLVPKE